jgi:SAM-dependent methyltransferase
MTDRDADWSAGYVTELEYTHGYYRELSPTLLRLACLSGGIAPPSTKHLRYLELGFGQGLSINVHAAALEGEFWGTDFNPAQVAYARAMTDAAGSGAKLFEESFAEFAARADLPEFDIIGLHGIWTWISDENSRVIVELIRRRLRAGGLVYLSYNCLPGWAASVPLRHLMKLHADFAAEASGMLAKLDGAVNFAQQVIDSGALFFRGNPEVPERLKRMSGADRHYLAHEFFNQDWRVMPFSELANWLEGAKLNFVASAHLLDHVEAVNLTEAGQKLLAGISHPVLRESVRDYLVNKQFRRDIFAKGARRMTSFEKMEEFRKQTFVLVTYADDIQMKVVGSLGEVGLQEQVYRPIIASFADSAYSPKTLGQLAADPRLNDIAFPNLVQAALVLTGAGHLCPAQEPPRQATVRCAALNRYLCERARSAGNITYLASPVCAVGIPVLRFQQLFLLAAHRGRKSPKDQAEFVWDLLAAQGQRLVKQGKTLVSVEENMDEILEQATEFTAKRLPVLKTLGVSLQ